MRLPILFDALWQDLKFGARQLRIHPAFALTAVSSLALGIGANTAIFTLVDQILLRLLPVERPHELVQLRAIGPRAGNQSGDGVHTFSYPAYVALRDRNSVLSGLSGQRVEPASLVGTDRSELINVGLVAGNFFQVLGVRPHLGRLLTPDDDRTRNSHPIAVLRYDFWRDRFGGRGEVVGSIIRLNGTPFTVVGIADRAFGGTDVSLPTEAWVPVMMKLAITPAWDGLDDERDAWFYLFGRLKPGVTFAQANAAMKVLYRQRQQEEVQREFFAKFPEQKDRFLRQDFSLIPASRGQSGLRRRFERPLLVLQWLVGVVLLIACTNVANLLLARGAARQREVAIRGALGASRTQLARQLFVESLLIALAGGAAGLFLSIWLARGLIRFLPFDPANLSLSPTPDLRILLFTSALTLLTALVFGLVPALRGSRLPAAATLKEEAGSISGGHTHVRLRKCFVALQVGLSALLLIGAGLFVRTLQNLRNVDLGFNLESVVMFGLRPATVYDPPRKLHVFRSVLESLSALPGVRSVAANRNRLLTGSRWDSSITLPGVEGRGDNQPWSYFNAVTPGYFETLGIPIKAGRDLSWSDWDSSRRVCLVNESFVNRYLDGATPVGRNMAQGARQTPDTEIVGVFADTRYDDVRGEIPRQTFINLAAILERVSGVTVYARIHGDPRQVLPLFRDQVRRVDPNLVVSDLRMLDEQLNMRLSNERILSFLSAGFALLATLLSIVGLHGVLSFVVARRTREIGIRMALGASRRSVVRLVFREMLFVILIGLTAGLAAGYLSGRYVESQLFGVRAEDPWVFAASGLALLAAALGAALLPAWRASHLDPVSALRCE